MRADALSRISEATLLGSLGATAKDISFRKRQIIYSVGDTSDSIYLIKVGSIKLTVVSAEGNEAVTAILKGGELFGPETLDITPSRRVTNAIALTSVRAAKIDRNTMMELVLGNPTICLLFMSSLIRRITLLQDEVAGNLLYNSEQRLARTLLSFAQLAEAHTQQHVPSLSQQELASIIGVTRQRVNVLLKQFRTLGHIDDARGHHVNKSLREVAGAELITHNTQ